MNSHLLNRKKLISTLRAEIVGPPPRIKGIEIQVEPGSEYRFSREDWRAVKFQFNGEEILWQDSPLKRYGAGILFPKETQLLSESTPEESQPDLETQSVGIDESGLVSLQIAEVKGDSPTDEEHTNGIDKLGDLQEEEDLKLANAFNPAAMGMSFLIRKPRLPGQILRCRVANRFRVDRSEFMETSCGLYRGEKAIIQDPADTTARPLEKSFWLREQIIENGSIPVREIAIDDLFSKSRGDTKDVSIRALLLRISWVSRKWNDPQSGEEHRIISISLVNRSKAGAELRHSWKVCLFQAGLDLVAGDDTQALIAPYPVTLGDLTFESSSDERVNALLYRNNKTYAIGHGCAVDWESCASGCYRLWSDSMPTYETPNSNANLKISNPSGALEDLKISMRKLAGFDEADDGMADLDLLVLEYEKWIERLDHPAKLGELTKSEGETHAILGSRRRECLRRIKDGLSLLRNPEYPEASAAFKLANEAMLLSQFRQKIPLRKPFQTKNKWGWPQIEVDLDYRRQNDKVGLWRPFQIAFLLMNIRPFVDDTSDEREIVDLIWFPTGGGKTEAYLGLSAFVLLYLRFSRGDGASCKASCKVLMRYTLRLLTAQQLQRAALLFCSLEHIRSLKLGELGTRPFRIGLWAGRGLTPNSRKDAVDDYTKLKSDKDQQGSRFVLERCPWCGAKIGQVAQDEVHGLHIANVPKTVVFGCSDPQCDFHYGALSPRCLPIVVVDEDIYADPPDLLIATVDKFAQLPWNPAIRSIFGISADGERIHPPPAMIIQDELHLISGPLGSMVGIYEAAIDALCRDREYPTIGPKIVASTATISRAADQIVALYGKEKTQVSVFPTPGINEDDSFFARHDRDESGQLKPGRLYCGVLASSHGSLQTTFTRVCALLAQFPASVQGEERDPWWTNICFFNSLRELGSAHGLLLSDLPQYSQVLQARYGLASNEARKLIGANVLELTSRIPDGQVTPTLNRLEQAYKGSSLTSDAVDVCLASNIIEVGLDIPRLGLMTILGQPKTTAQYIQVSSRVGRKQEQPGVVIVLYSPTKSRDRSHYERFRSYHESLYSQVEPTSVTPFSLPVIRRALHAILVSMLRQLGTRDSSKNSRGPIPVDRESALLEFCESLMEKRLSKILKLDAKAREAVFDLWKYRIKEWKAWEPSAYGSFQSKEEDKHLMIGADSVDGSIIEGRSWRTMNSLRGVDLICEAIVADPIMEKE